MNKRLIKFLAGPALGLLAIAGTAMAASEYRDLGVSTDFVTTNNIYLDGDVTYANTGWPLLWGSTTGVVGQFPLVEDATAGQEYWATTPSPASGQVTSRVIKMQMFMRVRVNSANLPNASAPLYFTIRYRDDVIPNGDTGVPVYFWKGGTVYTKMGTIGGARDGKWKTAQFTIPTASGIFSDAGAHYIFKVGWDRGSNYVCGELPIDKIKVGTDATKTEFEADANGLYPAFPTSNFANIASTHEFIPGQGAFFPLGVYMKELISDGGSATTAGHGSHDTWQCLQNAGMNCYTWLGYNQVWGSFWNQWPTLFTWDDPGIYTEIGMPQHLIQAAGHNLKVLPVTQTDVRSWWIKNQYGNEAACRTAMKSMYSTNGANANFLGMEAIDEFDHQDDTYNSPFAFQRLLSYDMITTVPNRPRFANAMGWMGSITWKAGDPNWDVFMNDRYLWDSYIADDPTHGSTLDPHWGLADQASRLDVMYANLTPGKMAMCIPESCDSHAPISQRDIVSQAYLAICHGSGGILYWNAPNKIDPRPNQTALASMWAGLTQVGTEFNGPSGIIPALLPPATVDELNGHSGKVTVTGATGIHTTLRTLGTTKYLIVLNALDQTVTPTYTVVAGQGLAGGNTVTVRFDSRTVTAGTSGANATIVDSVGPYERRVYTWTTGAPREVLIDLGNTSTTTVDGSGRHWNNITDRISGIVTGAVDSANVTTGITAAITDAFYYHSEGGATTTTTGYPSTATKDCYYTLKGYDSLGSVTLSSLSPTATYDVKLYCSDNTTSPSGFTKFTVVGSTSQSAVMDVNNTNNSVTMSGVHPDANNKIRIDVTNDPNTTGATVGGLGVIDLTIH